jgi:hypothetical protein
MTPIVNKDRPNTGVHDMFLSANVILCCGEDWAELLVALGQITGEQPLLQHEYRCYRVSKFENFSLIWSGMGTGCLEPLLYELRDVPFLTNIILVGTAGATSTETIKLGQICFCEEAFLGGAAVHLVNSVFPLTPRFKLDLITPCIPGARIVSTDYYYGFSRNPDPASVRLRSTDVLLESAVAQLFDEVDLIDMETAQFYHFCSELFPPKVSFLALKGAANSLSQQTLQTTNSLAVLRGALEVSFVALGIKTRSPITASTGLASKEDIPSKVMEEVKLFWTIQIAVCGVLGYLGSNLQLNAPETDVKNFAISVVALFLLQIGAMYNVIGNYYARVAASGSRLAFQQENRITPILAVFYLAISGLVAALTLTSFSWASEWWIIAGAAVGVTLNWFICRRVVYESLAGIEQPGADYIRYATPLRRVYFWSMMILLLILLGLAIIYPAGLCFH